MTPLAQLQDMYMQVASEVADLKRELARHRSEIDSLVNGLNMLEREPIARAIQPPPPPPPCDPSGCTSSGLAVELISRLARVSSGKGRSMTLYPDGSCRVEISGTAERLSSRSATVTLASVANFMHRTGISSSDKPDASDTNLDA